MSFPYRPVTDLFLSMFPGFTSLWTTFCSFRYFIPFAVKRAERKSRLFANSREIVKCKFVKKIVWQW